MTLWENPSKCIKAMYFVLWFQGFLKNISTGLEGLFNFKVGTVFHNIVPAATILFWKLECGKYSREETNQGRKLIIS